jgi:hypothetical protein
LLCLSIFFLFFPSTSGPSLAFPCLQVCNILALFSAPLVNTALSFLKKVSEGHLRYLLYLPLEPRRLLFVDHFFRVRTFLKSLLDFLIDTSMVSIKVTSNARFFFPILSPRAPSPDYAILYHRWSYIQIYNPGRSP